MKVYSELPSVSLYVHIPFCLKKCPYCDFNTYAVTHIPEVEYVDALLQEMCYRAEKREWSHRRLHSIYFGGGTPSLLSDRSIRKIVSAACQIFRPLRSIEISMEANPGTLKLDLLRRFRDAGVNRVSFGAQSLNQQTLKTLGRTHTPEQVYAAVDNARLAGLSNINLDLMYGVPDQTLSDLEQDIEAYRSLDVPHISAYGLTLEKGTPFFQAYRQKLLHLPDEDVVSEMMDCIEQRLPQYGLQQYEISNFSKPGMHAMHNVAYWRHLEYLGLGAGAHSFVRVPESQRYCPTRWANTAQPKAYIKEVGKRGHAEAWSETLTFEGEVFEHFFLGLRMVDGVSKKHFQEQFGCSVHQVYPALLTVLHDEGLLIVDQDSVRLSERGARLADSVIENFAEVELAPGSHAVGA